MKTANTVFSAAIQPLQARPGSLMGVVGMLIFIPIVSVAYALFREIVYLKLKKQGVDPAELEV